MQNLTKHRASGVCVSFLIALILSLGFVSQFYAIAFDEASSKIDEADKTLREAFVAVLDAESVGANVSILIDQLNMSAGLLGEAEMAYQNGNVTEAINLADQSITISNNAKTETVTLKDSALTREHLALLLDSTFSVVAITVFLIVLGFAWKRFKRSYVGRLQKMKPEVVSNAQT